jgi:hypothetical protein
MTPDQFDRIFTHERPQVTPAALLYVGSWAFLLGACIGALAISYFMGAPRC